MWTKKDNKLYRRIEFKNFDEAFSFMEKVAVICKRMNHHPKWTNEWNVVEIWLSSHEKGDIVSDKDTLLAEEIDKLIQDDEQTDYDINSLKLFTDGGSRGNPGPSASGFVILDQNDNIVFKNGIYLGVTTNNQAEYLALKFGIEKLIDLKSKNVSIYMDSLLIINQMKGTYKIKNPELLNIYNEIKVLLKNFDNVNFTHVPRAMNKLADLEVNIALDKAIA
jgi:ribonuclease HI/pterin-4a-carbinolamine dehydratase